MWLVKKNHTSIDTSEIETMCTTRHGTSRWRFRRKCTCQSTFIFCFWKCHMTLLDLWAEHGNEICPTYTRHFTHESAVLFPQLWQGCIPRFSYQGLITLSPSAAMCMWCGEIGIWDFTWYYWTEAGLVKASVSRGFCEYDSELYIYTDCTKKKTLIVLSYPHASFIRRRSENFLPPWSCTPVHFCLGVCDVSLEILLGCCLSFIVIQRFNVVKKCEVLANYLICQTEILTMNNASNNKLL